MRRADQGYRIFCGAIFEKMMFFPAVRKFYFYVGVLS
jgi:hypothetical protein